MLVLSILSFFISVFIVDVGACIAGVSPDASFLVLSAVVLAGAAKIAGASPLTRPRSSTASDRTGPARRPVAPRP